MTPSSTNLQVLDLYESHPDKSNIGPNLLLAEGAAERTKIRPCYMLLIVASIPLFSTIYYLVGTRWLESNLNFIQYFVLSTLVAIAVTGIYQVFFWVQRNNRMFQTQCFKIGLDDYIPFWPSWIWLYSYTYYVAIGLVIVSVPSIEHAVYLIFGGAMLMAVQAVFFLFLPTSVPSEWRMYADNSLSARCLRFVQSIDNGRNCFPSMHCSVAAYIGLALFPILGFISWIFVVLIAMSCLFVKQHQIVDILPGILLGWLVFSITPMI